MKLRIDHEVTIIINLMLFLGTPFKIRNCLSKTAAKATKLDAVLFLIKCNQNSEHLVIPPNVFKKATFLDQFLAGGWSFSRSSENVILFHQNFDYVMIERLLQYFFSEKL